MQNNTFSTLFVGQNLIKLKEVDSTNNYLKKMVSNSDPLPEGTVIMADHQFAGRGQQESVWHTEPGKNISTSIYLKPSFLPLEMQFYLNILVSLAVADALSDILPDPVEVKWPNDIYYNKRKLGGILIESTLTGSIIKSTIVGLGLNVNQAEFQEKLSTNAISIRQILHKEVELERIMEKIFFFMEKYYLNLKSKRYDFLGKEYLKRLLNYNIKSGYRQNGRVFEGVIVGVEANGLLRVEVEGELRRFNFKEIEYIHTQIKQ
ncbi:biotin--[acetyl-CoA-carboxylase] ligase [Pedobacter sp. Leaf176]|uniref:biotin--[acetyl-CoA-carboxylase] ligase n=1 Tax=Pedobacter sp. Leaf176 TaxID=1736286 RepID=UPI0006FA6CC8|nr:biotin--[acetyl-CoA-carboxylase] ligase [Pedobacter sp. Leaf176]KQR71856.1 biotin biosynthesis protein BioC [Pedobacter sp. Leaf176]